MTLVSAIATAFFVIAVAMVSCTHPQVAFRTVSFKSDVIPIFTASCALNSSCHSGANNANDEVDLDSSAAYNTIISRHLVTGDPNTSILYSQVHSGVMPKAPNSPLPAGQIEIIYNWIKQGSQDN